MDATVRRPMIQVRLANAWQLDRRSFLNRSTMLGEIPRIIPEPVSDHSCVGQRCFTKFRGSLLTRSAMLPASVKDASPNSDDHS